METRWAVPAKGILCFVSSKCQERLQIIDSMSLVLNIQINDIY